MNATSKRFRIALSFPGEEREYVKQVADRLACRVGEEWVLYDDYHEAEFARLDLDIYLPRLYQEESELIAIFVCSDYPNKRWCCLEWRAVRVLIESRSADIIPLRFDDTDIPGLSINDGNIWIVKPGTDQERRPAHEIADKIFARWKMNHQLPPTPPGDNLPQGRHLVVPGEQHEPGFWVKDSAGNWHLFPSKLPTLQHDKVIDSAKEPCDRRDWEHMHTLSERMLDTMETVRILMVRLSTPQPESDNKESEKRWISEAFKNTFSKKVVFLTDRIAQLAPTARETCCAQVIARLPICMNAIQQSLGYLPGSPEIEDATSLVEHICIWLTDIVKEANHVLRAPTSNQSGAPSWPEHGAYKI